MIGMMAGGSRSAALGARCGARCGAPGRRAGARAILLAGFVAKARAPPRRPQRAGCSAARRVPIMPQIHPIIPLALQGLAYLEARFGP